MTIIALNSEEFEFSYYSRNTYFNNSEISSNASISGLKGNDIANTLTALAQDTITTIQIKKDNVVIYSLDNISAKIQSFEESYDGYNFNVNLNINFNNLE